MTDIKRFRWRKEHAEIMKGHSRGEWVTYREHAAVVRALKSQLRRKDAKKCLRCGAGAEWLK